MRTLGLVLLGAVALAQDPATKKVPPPPEEHSVSGLLTVRRVCVDRLGGGDTAAQIRDMIIASLQASKLFIVTENPERADAFLRGSAEDLVFTDTYSSSENLDARAGVSRSRNSSKSVGGYINAGAGESESVHVAERKHESTAAVRLVDKDGDVIWSTTQESQGGKFRGASADVADRVVRQLVADYERAKKARSKGSVSTEQPANVPK